MTYLVTKEESGFEEQILCEVDTIKKARQYISDSVKESPPNDDYQDNYMIYKKVELYEVENEPQPKITIKKTVFK